MALWSRRSSAYRAATPTVALGAGASAKSGCLAKILITTAAVLAAIALWLGVLMQTAPSGPSSAEPVGEEPLTDRSPRVVENPVWPGAPATEAPTSTEPSMPQPAPPDPPPSALLGRFGWLAELGLRNLLVPVAGVQRAQLQDTYEDRRGAGRRHEAIDILAPRNTPVLAAGDGAVVKLFKSVPGGLTIYQFDREGRYCYYYAHLERYADGVKEKAMVARGEVIGYVGTSGNAPPETPHLHFAIYRLGSDRRWWEGEPLNPFPILRSGPD